ncbi:MAG: OmpA family protein [Plesiomonas sp.]|uniref:OmpA family protein n=1 Tax=Plesiomonas sp. TaxID=2486279 RepID=UPI003F3CDB1B
MRYWVRKKNSLSIQLLLGLVWGVSPILKVQADIPVLYTENEPMNGQYTASASRQKSGFTVREERVAGGYQMPIAGPYSAQVIPPECHADLLSNQYDVLAVQPLYFAFNRSEITAADQRVLHCLVQVMQQSDLRVGVVGNTDSIGSAGYNHTLGLRRAHATMTALVQQNAPVEQIDAVRSAGESAPIASNSSIEGRALNRRVQFVLQVP